MKKAFALKNDLIILPLFAMEVGLGYLSQAIHFPVAGNTGEVRKGLGLTCGGTDEGI